MNAKPIKFNFNQSFSSGEAAQSKDASSLETARLEAHNSGYAQGFIDGQNSNEVQVLNAIDAKIQTLFLQASTTLTEIDGVALQIAQDSIRISTLMAKTLARKVLSKFPQETIEQLAEECFRNMRKTPHIVFRVTPDLVETMEARLQKRADEFGFDGRIIIIGDPDFNACDVKIEWADGGYAFNAQHIEQDLDNCVSNWLNAHVSSTERGL